MASDAVRERVETVVREQLLTNGGGEVAERLVLMLPDGRDGGGWGAAPLVDRVLTLVREGRAQALEEAAETPRLSYETRDWLRELAKKEREGA